MRFVIAPDEFPLVIQRIDAVVVDVGHATGGIDDDRLTPSTSMSFGPTSLASSSRASGSSCESATSRPSGHRSKRGSEGRRT